MDPTTLCRLATSCEEARRVDDTHYEGRIRVKVSLLTVNLLIQGEVLETRSPEYIRARLRGQSAGLPGSFQGEVSCSLTETDAACVGRYLLSFSVLGRLGSLGAPLFQTTAQRMADAFAEKLSGHLRTHS